MSKENKEVVLRGKGRPSKIEQYGLIQHAIDLLKVQPKLTYQQIADELNVIGQVPPEDHITAENVAHFAKAYPEIRREILLANRAHMRKLVLESAEFDMLGTLKDMAARFTFMIDAMEEDAFSEGRLPNATAYKAITSELRETLKQIENIHKEVYDMEIVRQFLIEVVKTLQEVSPEALQAFIAKMKGKRENNHIVNELLKGGLS
jgi:hypothetical protein